MDFKTLPPKVFTATGAWMAAAVIWYGVPAWLVLAVGWIVAAYGLAPYAWQYSVGRTLGG